MIKKAMAFLAALLLAAGLLTGCGSQGGSDTPTAPAGAASDGAEDKIQVVCTIFPQYDWVREIIGGRDAAGLSLLISSGTDMHSYQPSAADVVRISKCDLFIYVGGASDRWVDDALEAAVNEDMVVINMLEVLGSAAKAEELKEGMTPEDARGEDGDETEYDEHVWLSLKNAQVICEAISQALSTLDPEGAAVYAENTRDYLEKLSRLDADYESLAEGAAQHTILVADRFPFRYLTEDYGLDYYAAFPGCSAETEASFETVAFLAGKLDALGLDTVLILENSKKDLAETIIASTAAKDQQILVLDSLQSVTMAQIGQGKTYLSAMEANLGVLTQALGGIVK